MNGEQLAALINRRAEESRQRDDEMLLAIHKLETTTAVHSERLDAIDDRLDRESERRAEDSGAFMAVRIKNAEDKVALAEKQTAEMTRWKRHWLLWLAGIVAAICSAAVGAGLERAFGG